MSILFNHIEDYFIIYYVYQLFNLKLQVKDQIQCEFSHTQIPAYFFHFPFQQFLPCRLVQAHHFSVKFHTSFITILDLHYYVIIYLSLLLHSHIHYNTTCQTFIFSFLDSSPISLPLTLYIFNIIHYQSLYISLIFPQYISFQSTHLYSSLIQHHLFPITQFKLFTFLFAFFTKKNHSKKSTKKKSTSQHLGTNIPTPSFISIQQSQLFLKT